MSPEKFIKYSVPFFVIAIISRSIEEISFFYYAVPALCVFFILFGIWLFKNDKRRKESDPSFWRSPESEKASDSDSRRAGRTDSEQVGMTDRAGRTDFEQVGMTGSKIGDQHPSPLMLRRTGLPSPIFQQPYFLFLLPGLWFLMTSLWSSYPEVSATRALYFILISTGCISAGILWIRFSNKNIFDFLLPANVIVVLICLFSLITNIPSDSWTAGHGKGFMGFFGHQNLLASVLLFTLPYVLYRIVILAKSRIQRTGSDSRQAGMTATSITNMRRLESSTLVLIAYCLLLTANLLLIMLTYSRASILSLVIGALVFLIFNKNWKVLSYGFIVGVILTSIIYFTPSLNNFADKILKKDFPEVYSSRMWMWEPSYNAALEGGLFGLGYGISHPEIRSGEYSDRFENGRLIREKGNSALALVEESGLIGLILFIIPIFYILLRVIIGKDSLLTTNHSLLIAASAAFLLHAQFEAWWIGVGSVQLPLFFLYLGLLVQSSKFNS